MFNLASNDGAFDGVLVSTNADSDTSRHTCHVSAMFYQYGVKRTLVAPPLGRLGTLLQLLECRIFEITAVRGRDPKHCCCLVAGD